MATSQSQYSFGWQGGEPALMGLDFLKLVTKLQRKYGQAGTIVANGLQTNGILIDDEFARHLEQSKFLVGIIAWMAPLKFMTAIADLRMAGEVMPALCRYCAR